MKVNKKCSGGYCKNPNGEVREYWSNGRKIILCKDCIDAINQWIFNRKGNLPPNIHINPIKWDLLSLNKCV